MILEKNPLPLIIQPGLAKGSSTNPMGPTGPMTSDQPWSTLPWASWQWSHRGTWSRNLSCDSRALRHARRGSQQSLRRWLQDHHHICEILLNESPNYLHPLSGEFSIPSSGRCYDWRCKPIRPAKHNPRAYPSEKPQKKLGLPLRLGGDNSTHSSCCRTQELASSFHSLGKENM